MSIKSTLVLIAKVILLIVLFMVVMTVSYMALPTTALLPVPPEGTETAQAIGALLTAIVDTLVITVIILTSRQRGWQLMVTVFVSMVGVTTVMTQSEILYFGPAMGIPATLVPAIALPLLLTFAVFSPLAVTILGRLKHDPEELAGEGVVMSIREWAIKLGLIAIVYLILYFSFGYMVAWQNPELREMYGNGTNTAVFNATIFVPFQMFRSVLWVLFALPVLRHAKGKAWQVAILIGLLYALPMNIGHATPNPFMPDPSVRLAHFIETTTSNFIFGLTVTWLLHRSHSTVKDLVNLKGKQQQQVVVS